MRPWPPLVALAALACRPAPAEAPVELDELVRFFLAQVEAADDTLAWDGATNLAAWYDEAPLEDGWTSGGLSDLSAEEVQATGLMTWEPEVERSVGVYVLGELPCPLDAALDVYLDPDQLALFPDAYTDYERTWEGEDPRCLADGSCRLATWRADIEDTLAGFATSYTLISHLRSVTAEGGERALIGRSVMPEPALEDVAAASFEQSYHVEAFVPREGERTLHLYALWNHGTITGVSDDVAFWPNQYVDGLFEWEGWLAELCAG